MSPEWRYQPGISQLWVIVLLVSAVLYVLLGWQYGFLFEHRDGFRLGRGTDPGRWFGVVRFFMIFSGLVACALLRRARASVGCAVLLSLLLLPMFVAGKRGEFLTIAAALGVVLTIRGLRLRPRVTVPIVAVGLLSVPIVRNFRRRLAFGEEIYGDSWLLDPLIEMGLTLRALTYSVEARATGVTDLWMGGSYRGAVARLFPNVGPLREWVGVGGMEDSPRSRRARSPGTAYERGGVSREASVVSGVNLLPRPA
jgi:hypothetical protein